jgi:hypothetical protein
MYLLITGMINFFASLLAFFLRLNSNVGKLIYISITVVGFIMVLTGGTLLSRIIHQRISNKDIFNKENETFPHEERLLENEYSINLPAKYFLKGKARKSIF